MALTQVKTLGIAADAVTGAKVADDQIDSEHYVAGSIDNEHLADDAVGLAEMAGLARGRLIVGDASGNPSALAAGSNDQVLTMDANGDVGWEAAAAGGATINNATANELVTVASTTTQLDAESALTFDGTKVVLGGQTARAIDGYQGTLQIEGTGDTTTSISIVRNSNDNHPPSLNFGKSKGGANGDSTIVADATSLGQITFKAADGTDMECEGARIEAISWSSQAGNNTPTALQFRMNAGAASSTVAGRFVPNGNLEIEDGNLRVASGHGIDFSSTAGPAAGSDTQELLDDYEEGTWTPNVVFASTDATGQSGNGHYTKIGRMVYASYRFTLTNKGGGSGSFSLEGFPYAPSTGYSDIASGIGYSHRFADANNDSGQVEAQFYSSIMYLAYRGLNANTTRLSDSNFRDDTALSGMVVYYSNA